MATIRDGTVDIEVDVPENPEISVLGHSGDIVIEGTEGSSIRVHADGIDSEAAIDGEPFGTALTGNRLTIDMHRHGGSLSADLRIEVPAGCSVTVNTVEGDIRVHDTGGPVELTSVGGDVVVGGVQGAARITTVSGDVRGERLTGTLTLHTTNGDVTVLRSSLQRFNVHSVNGSLSFETPLQRGEHYFAKTTNGDIRIAIPGDTGAVVQMRTTNGDLRCSLPTDVINRSRRNWQGRINDGGATLELETLNGDVIIEESRLAGAAEHVRRPHMPEPPRHVRPVGPPDTMWTPGTPEAPGFLDIPTPPEMPGMPDRPEMPDLHVGDTDPAGEGRSSGARVDYSSDDSIAILGRLERGEITVEEAMERLDALR